MKTHGLLLITCIYIIQREAQLPWPHRWWIGKRARLECGRSWVRAL